MCNLWTVCGQITFYIHSPYFCFHQHQNSLNKTLKTLIIHVNPVESIKDEEKENKRCPHFVDNAFESVDISVYKLTAN
ncbi:hypothetical protein CHCC14821_0490 [Bacillus paralicheniformis]|nr:hypothetical protein CHCC14821_0490 [Bacillus paralicheniformis]